MSDRNYRRPVVGITQGDGNGIGYEVIIKSLSDARILESFTPVIYGSSKIFGFYRKHIHNLDQMDTYVIQNARDAKPRKINIVNCLPDNTYVEPGQSTPESAKAAITSLEWAVRDIKNGDIDVLVTAPINKRAMVKEGFGNTGHTEYLSHQFGCSSLMIMVCDRIRIGIVTNHLALKDVPSAITHNLLYDKIMLMNESLKRDFGVPMPKIAVLALDPHGGDNGVIGTQDQTVVKPVIDEAQSKGVLAYGPFPSDGFFGSSEFNKFDGVLALYHDQGLIPFKLMSFTEGVNFTAGLPYVRTSPAHGTAFDIAGKDKASEQSFRSAVYLACKILRNRKEYDELTADPLR